VGALSLPIDVSQGTGTGRGIIAGISLQAISHISLAMMAGSQNNIGMVDLLCGYSSAQKACVPMLTVISRFVMLCLALFGRRRARGAAKKSPADRPGFVNTSRLDHT
jgi:hypothetical protein